MRVKSSKYVYSDKRIGEIYGLWKVIGEYNSLKWVCECQCDKKTIKNVNKYHLIDGDSASCGCKNKEKLIERNKMFKKYNQYDISGEYGIGITTNSLNEFYFDLEDYDLIKDYCWRESNRGYVVCTDNKNRTSFKIYHIVLSHEGGYDKDKIIDHINQNKLDNRKNNLRLTTQYVNVVNSKMQKNNTTGITGVYFRKNVKCQSWSSCIGKLYLGTYTNKDDAIKSRLIGELDIYGKDLSPQRHLFEEYGIGGE